ncbi:TOMM precursor leader peptide-binding protein [Spirosoma sp.]|uniref:TOMM precursor leader peptide-binding protein n=1 Tax=Spirosoma sp. TaxID=1899569 RepID=UPI00262000D9|nr:TOMM precursor leader peptide-binding protein [Spirosoma sp.]MCX6217966.1 TOMM precursor leader peptide-binding protein [Spirosoma sp.]
MKLDLDESRIIFLPSQLIEIDEGVILRRGIVQVKLTGELAFDLMNVLVTMASGDGIAEADLLAYFGESLHETIVQILHDLRQKGFLVDASKAELDTLEASDAYRQPLLHWNLGLTPDSLQRILQKSIVVLGVNTVSRQLVSSLRESGFGNVTLVDTPLFRNITFFGSTDTLLEPYQTGVFASVVSYEEWVDNLSLSAPIDSLVVTSDFGGHQLMREFNKFAVDNKIPFMPVVLSNLKGYVGPFVMPGETACLECYLGRSNAQQRDYVTSRTVELAAYEGQIVSGFHPSMASILGDIAAFELFKQFGRIMQTWNAGTVLEINLLKTEMKPRKVLKLPRCPVCGTVHKRSPYTVFNSTYMLTNEE